MRVAVSVLLLCLIRLHAADEFPKMKGTILFRGVVPQGSSEVQCASCSTMALYSVSPEHKVQLIDNDLGETSAGIRVSPSGNYAAYTTKGYLVVMDGALRVLYKGDAGSFHGDSLCWDPAEAHYPDKGFLYSVSERLETVAWTRKNLEPFSPSEFAARFAGARSYKLKMRPVVHYGSMAWVEYQGCGLKPCRQITINEAAVDNVRLASAIWAGEWEPFEDVGLVVLPPLISSGQSDPLVFSANNTVWVLGWTGAHALVTLPTLAGFKISPDGRHLALVTASGLYIMHRPDPNPDTETDTRPKRIATTNGIEGLAWSPDSKYVATLLGGKLVAVHSVNRPDQSWEWARIPGTLARHRYAGGNLDWLPDQNNPPPKVRP
jgi:hypothetical protein